MIESIVAHLGIMSTHNRIANNSEHIMTFKERIQDAKRFTGGAILRNSYFSLGQTILELQHERNEDARVKREGTYKKNIQEYRDRKQNINKLLTSIESKEVDKWSFTDLKKMIHWKKVKADGVTPVRKKGLLVLWNLVRGRPELPCQRGTRRRYICMEESTMRPTTIYVKVTRSIKQRQFLSEFFVLIVLIFCEPPNICLCRFYIIYYHSKCAYEAEAVFEIRKTSS